MKVNKILKKRTSFFIISFFFIFFMVILSIIFISNSDFVKNGVKVDNRNLQLIYKENHGNVENSVFPMTFQQGLEADIQDNLQIVNKKQIKAKFSLCIQVIDASSDNLSTDKIYYSVGDLGGILGETNGCIYDGEVLGNESVDLSVKVWPGSDLITSEDSGKKVNIKYYIK